MIKQVSLSSLLLLITSLPAWAHDVPVEHAHSGGLTIYAVPAIAILATAVVVGLVAWSSRANRKDG